jgi:hypothetical protein
MFFFIHMVCKPIFYARKDFFLVYLQASHPYLLRKMKCICMFFKEITDKVSASKIAREFIAGKRKAQK